MIEKSKKQQIFESFFHQLGQMDSEQLMKIVETQLDDEELETFVAHLEDFYGINDDEELGTLAQIMVTGYLCAKFENKEFQLS